MKSILLFVLALATFILISCGNSTNTVAHDKCSESCDETWQQCNESTKKCEPKEGFCATNDDCKDNDGGAVCNEETHKCSADKCNPNPCKDNEGGNIVCKLAENEDGYECLCEEGFEFKDGKCTEVNNPCEPNPCKDNEDGKVICKEDKEAENGYVCISEEEDPCTPNPCENNESGAVVCKPSENEAGYECSCKEGFEFKDGKCTELSNPCEPNPCKDNEDGKVICKEDEEAENGYVCEKPDCDVTKVCENVGDTKCVDNNVLRCVLDEETYCTIWKQENDCGVGECIKPDEEDAYCTCQECNPDEFPPTCSEDYKSFQYCDNTGGCFTIKTVNCEGATHCEDESGDGNLACVANDCTDDPSCSSVGDKRCATSGGASILQECRVNAEGCLELYTAIDCSANNMECDEYNDEIQCIGGVGSDECISSGNPDPYEIKMNGVWLSSTVGFSNDYTGCEYDDFEGKDVAYFIRVEDGENLKLTLTSRGDNGNVTTGHVSPAIYVMKANCNNRNFCNSAISSEEDEGASVSLSLTNLEGGKYNIIIDSDKASSIMGKADAFDYELIVDLQ